MKLVKFSRDWADEFVAEGFGALPDEEWQQFVDFVHLNPNVDVSFYFGTNEGWDYETLQSFYDCYKVTDISTEEVETLVRLFGNRWKRVSFGVFPHPLELIESLDE